MNRLNSFSKTEAVNWLADHGLSVSGTRNELINKIQMYERYPNLVQKLRKRVMFNRSFPCSLEQTSIPPLTAPWKADDMLPIVTTETFQNYASQKTEGSLGQQEKAVRMLQSRKIITVKTLVDGVNIYVRAMIKNSFGCEPRPAVILFCNNLPQRAYCRCTVGLSGICCNVLALLLYLQHFAESGEKLLELTCTQQLQKWHKRSRKGSIPMVPLSQIKVKSAKKRKGKDGIAICAADPDKSAFKRSVPNMMKEIEKKMENIKPVTEHFHSVLSKSVIGRKSSYGEHICFKYAMEKFMDHDYVSQENFDKNVLGINPDKKQLIENKHFEKTSTVSCNSSSQQSTNILLNQIDMNVFTQSTPGMYETNICFEMQEKIKKQGVSGIVNIDISFLEAPTPAGDNYIDCAQKSIKWHEARKYKFTGSRLPALLGFYGRKQFDKYWSIVRHGTEDNTLSGITNIKRGIEFESEALQYFEMVSKSKATVCGFFLHPINNNYGASPDALCASGIILEIKTRAANSEGPLTSLKDFPNYFVQCQIQMECTHAHSCTLLSYHPETQQGTFFLITRDNVMTNIIIDLCECILNNRTLLDWHHMETKELSKLGENILRKKIDFESLKPLRFYIKTHCKNIPQVVFCDEMYCED